MNDWAAYIDQLIQDCADREATANLRATRTPDGSQDEQTSIQALPTIYRDTQFRSLLEACWAATLDSLGIVWEYEPQTFDLPSGVKYLPDFHLPEIGTWLEVKGPGVPRIEKPYELGEMLACGCPVRSCDCRWAGGELVIIGHPPTPFDPWNEDGYRHWPSSAKSKLARCHGGFIHWTSTRRHNSWMVKCSSCARVSWAEGPRLQCCRGCGEALGSNLYRDFEKRFEFVRLPWLSGSSIQPDDPAATGPTPPPDVCTCAKCGGNPNSQTTHHGIDAA
ncbi:hypothetical protein [Streptomyces sp. NPDC056817]|uniref:hypothetical protein n=1 Tax=Streptomyces sp. NPDC056817 TaxID=3345950 RepID=UPI0036A90F67